MMMIFLFVELSGEYARNISAAHNLHFFKNSLSDCDSTRRERECDGAKSSRNRASRC